MSLIATRTVVRGLGIAALLGTLSSARTSAAEPQGFKLSRFEPSERGSRWFVLDSLTFEGKGRLAVGVVGDYARDLLQARATLSSTSGARTEEVRVVGQAVTAHLGGSFVAWERLRLGVDLPIGVYADGKDLREGGGAVMLRGGRGGTVGDLRLAADVKVGGVGRRLLVTALGAAVYVPTGDRDAYQSQGKLGLGLFARAAGERGAFAYASRAGVLLQPEQRVGDPGSSKTGGRELRLGASLGRTLLGGKLLVGPELWASTPLGSDFGVEERTALDALLGAHLQLGSSWQLGAGVGRGWTSAFGEASVRALASVEWAEPLQGRARAEGRLEASGPGGGTAAAVGAPVQAGAEPTAASPKGVELDQDGDGVPDSSDACVAERGLASALAQDNGCPDRDRDQDGLPLDRDACPEQPGPASSDPAKSGCPVEQTEASALEPIYFRPGNHRLLPRDAAALEKVLALSKTLRPSQLILVEGHTDGRGPGETNQALSERRARAVIAWLVQHGAESSRLVPLGFGESVKASEEPTNDGLRMNRRVEFKVIELPSAP